MLKFLLSGLWICIVTSASVYIASSWSAGASNPASDEPYIKGLDYQKTRQLTVPVIRDGEVQGYLLARFVFTADAETLRRLAVPPEVFVVDEAFRQLYSDDDIDFEHLKKFDLLQLTEAITENVNARMQFDLLQDTLVEQLDYFPSSMIDEQGGEAVLKEPATAKADPHAAAH